ncbi:MAG: transposase [Cyclobacteriaceae bacterium]|nr:transposase [Cyclobacteriaceae bacterium]
MNKWHNLLLDDRYKEIIIESLKNLTNAGKIDIFAFIIMPNHIHLIWRINENNGKETTQGSFLKYTAHEFKKLLKKDDQKQLSKYFVNAANKKYEFWQRDSLAIHLYTDEVAFQKLDYIHDNPLSEYWQLVSDPCDYKYSSAAFYEKEIKNFPFLKDLRDEF